MKDRLGEKCEEIFVALMTESHSDKGAIFKPRYLDDKLPYVDYIVELVGAGQSAPYFFVQVKSTTQGCTKKQNRLKVKFSQESVRGIASYPAPTYIIGIDEKEKTGYLISANGEELGSMSSLPTIFPIDMQNRGVLWNEVNDFWFKCSRNKIKWKFVEPEDE